MLLYTYVIVYLCYCIPMLLYTYATVYTYAGAPRDSLTAQNRELLFANWLAYQNYRISLLHHSTLTDILWVHSLHLKTYFVWGLIDVANAVIYYY